MFSSSSCEKFHLLYAEQLTQHAGREAADVFLVALDCIVIMKIHAPDSLSVYTGGRMHMLYQSNETLCTAIGQLYAKLQEQAADPMKWQPKPPGPARKRTALLPAQTPPRGAQTDADVSKVISSCFLQISDCVFYSVTQPAPAGKDWTFVFTSGQRRNRRAFPVRAALRSDL